MLHAHKERLFDKDIGLLAFPLAVREVKTADNGTSSLSDYGQLTFEGAYVYHFDLENGFRLQGRISHVTAADQLKARIRRLLPGARRQAVLYIGDVMYTISNGVVKANALDTLTELGELCYNVK